jgi:hypothetical protein
MGTTLAGLYRPTQGYAHMRTEASTVSVLLRGLLGDKRSRIQARELRSALPAARTPFEVEIHHDEYSRLQCHARQLLATS